MAGWNTSISDSINTKTRTYVGAGHTPSYQASGTPYVHSADANYTIDFDYVTRAITVVSSAAGNSISFGDADDTSFPLPQGQAVRFEIRCKQVSATVVGGTVSICAELTGIEAGQLAAHDQTNFGTEAGGE